MATITPQLVQAGYVQVLKERINALVMKIINLKDSFQCGLIPYLNKEILHSVKGDF